MIREFSSRSAFVFAAQEKGFAVYARVGLEREGEADLLALNEWGEQVGHFTSEAGVVNLTDGVLAETKDEYLSYEG